MSFSNSKQYAQQKNSSTSDRPPKVKRYEYTNQAENSTTFVKKAQKNQGEDYYGKSQQTNIENSQNNHKPARTRQYKTSQVEAYNHQENSQKENKRSQKNNQQTYVPKGNQDQIQRSKESGIDKEAEDRAENDSVRKSQNKRQGKGRKNRNQDQFGDVVYYVKKSSNENKQINEEEQKEGKNQKTIESSDKQENKEDVIEKKGELEAHNTQAQDLAKQILSQLKLNDKFKTEGIRQSESSVKSASLLQNKQDNISQAVPKPIIEVSIPPSETQSVIENSQSLQDDKEVSVISETETSHSRQACSIPDYPQPQMMSPVLNSPQMPASADQQRVMFAPGYPQIPMFQAPFVIFPQPNGTSFIQPLYQMPGMNMMPRRAEEEQERFNQQPIYLVPSAMLPTVPIAENLQNNENRQNSDRIAGQFFPGYAINPHFMPYAQIHPGFIANTLIANPVATQQVYVNTNINSSENENQKASLNDSQVKEESASDRRDD